MNPDNRKGRLCGLIAAGLRLEGLLRVVADRPDVEKEAEAEIREAYALYSALFNDLFPEAEGVSDESMDVQDEPAEAIASCETDAVSEQPEAAEEPAGEELVEVVPEIAEAEVEAEPEAEQEAEEAEEAECAEDAGEAETEEVEAVLETPRPLADTLKVDELIARKESADLRRAFTLNDKFRFRRTIFGGSDELFSNTLVQLEQLPDYEAALGYLADILPENGEDNDDFLSIVKAHYESRQ